MNEESWVLRAKSESWYFERTLLFDGTVPDAGPTRQGLAVSLGAALFGLFWLVAMGWALWLEWFTTKLALDIHGIPAAGLVAMDVAIGLFLVGLTATVS